MNERKYESKRVTIGKIQGRRDSAKFVARYPVGAEVTVYYNPGDPSKAVLIRGMRGRNPFWVGVPIVVALGLILVIGAFRKYTG